MELLLKVNSWFPIAVSKLLLHKDEVGRCRKLEGATSFLCQCRQHDKERNPAVMR